MAWGEHTLILNGNGTRIEAVIAFKAGASPTVTSLKGQGVKAFLTAGLGPNTRVVATASGIPAKLDGNPVADVTEEGLLLKGIPQGAHELSLEAKNEPVRRIPFESGNRPYLTATVVSGTQTGLLRITTGEDDVLVTVSGSRRQVLTRQGRAIFGLAPAAMFVTGAMMWWNRVVRKRLR